MDGRELKAYERFKEQAQFYRARAYDLEAELRVVGRELYRAYQKIDRLERRVEKLTAENGVLKQRLKEIIPAREQADPPDSAPTGRGSCPRCNSFLVDLQDHQRIVEDIVPARVAVKCYRTRSGLCPCCRKRVESRAPEQVPAANLPHGQLGLNALATAVLLRIEHRLPFRQVASVFANLPGLSISAGAIARQVRRIAGWFDDDYEEIMPALRCAPHVHADERAIRPAVVARKISGGSRSPNGAQAWATLASLLRTANQQGQNLLETIKSMLMAAWASDKPSTMPAGP